MRISTMANSSNARPSDAVRAFLHTTMFQLGIVPMENTSDDYRRVLQQLSEADRRKMSRKFRKLWRAEAKARIRQEELTGRKSPKGFTPKNLGLGQQYPTKVQCRARKDAIYVAVWKQAIGPALKKVENLDNPCPSKKEED